MKLRLQIFDKIQMIISMMKNVHLKQPHIANEQEMLHILKIAVRRIIYSCIRNLK